MKNIYLNSAQLKTELEKCLQCKDKPCMQACPAHCSPCDFITEAKKHNWKKAAELITNANPQAECCGLICPDKFCIKSCLRSKLDCAIKISQVQATIMKIAEENGDISIEYPENNNKKIAVIGSGPAAIGATLQLLKSGFNVEIFEKESQLGGSLNLIPEYRLPKSVIQNDWHRIKKSNRVKIHLNHLIDDLNLLLLNFSGIIIACGEDKCCSLGVKGEEFAISCFDYLKNPEQFITKEKVAIIGGGAVAVDCAITAKKLSAQSVEMFVRRGISHMRLTSHERNELINEGIDITPLTRIIKLEKNHKNLSVTTIKTQFDDKGNLIDLPNSEIVRNDFKLVILALGGKKINPTKTPDNVIYAGDCINGGTTAVEAVASGKEAANKLIKQISA